MKLLFEHFFLAFSVGSIGWFLSGEVYCVLIALIFGWLIDADHLCDFFYYIIRSGKLNLSLVPTGKYFKANNKIIVPLHSWEISATLLLSAHFIPEYTAEFITAAFAHVVHLLQDQRTYHVRLYGYSFIFRMTSRFRYKGFCKNGND